MKKKMKSKIKKKPDSYAFLGGFTYTEDEICKCGHGIWDHKYDEKKKECNECTKYVMRDKKYGKCTFTPCKCKKFISKVKRRSDGRKTI